MNIRMILIAAAVLVALVAPAHAQFTLTTVRAGAGTGTITSSPAGITCGSTCAASYAPGTMVNLTATPAPGSTFAGWSGACSGTGGCVVTMDSAKSVTATFILTTHTLTVTRAGTGSGTVTSTPSGISCGSTCSSSYNSGTMVTLTAAPTSGSSFAGWSGGCTSTGSCTVTMDSARSVTATFTLNTFQLTVNRTGSGSVTSSPAGIGCPSTCSSSYNAGAMVVLTATPDPGASFLGWSGACTGTGACVVTMNSAMSVSASFTSAPNATLTVQRTGAGTGTVSSAPAGITCPSTCVFTFPTNTVVSLAALPGASSAFASFTGADTTTGNVASVTLSSNRTVAVNFACNADFDRSGSLDVQDIFEFLNAWFAGCP